MISFEDTNILSITVLRTEYSVMAPLLPTHPGSSYIVMVFLIVIALIRTYGVLLQ